MARFTKRLGITACAMLILTSGAASLIWLNQATTSPGAAASEAPATSGPDKTSLPGRSRAKLASSDPSVQLGVTHQVNPYVALALMSSATTTEERCPELAQQYAGEEGGLTLPNDRRNSRGCVLPIGGDPAASVQQASMPLERPTPLLARQRANYIPIAAGLGAGIAAVPVISGLKENKDKDQLEPISP